MKRGGQGQMGIYYIDSLCCNFRIWLSQ